MDHKKFMHIIWVATKRFLNTDRTQESFGDIGLTFIVKFITSFACCEVTHPLLSSCFTNFLSIFVPQTAIRARTFHFMGEILNSINVESQLDVSLREAIVKFTTYGLQDSHAAVRVEAINALKPFQDNNNPNDEIVKLYLIHLKGDPVEVVRRTVLIVIVKNMITIPAILERTQDIDESVRLQVYKVMANYSMKAMIVEQRQQFVENGLNDRSEDVVNVRRRFKLIFMEISQFIWVFLLFFVFIGSPRSIITMVLRIQWRLYRVFACVQTSSCR